MSCWIFRNGIVATGWVWLALCCSRRTRHCGGSCFFAAGACPLFLLLTWTANGDSREVTRWLVPPYLQVVVDLTSVPDDTPPSTSRAAALDDDVVCVGTTLGTRQMASPRPNKRARGGAARQGGVTSPLSKLPEVYRRPPSPDKGKPKCAICLDVMQAPASTPCGYDGSHCGLRTSHAPCMHLIGLRRGPTPHVLSLVLQACILPKLSYGMHQGKESMVSAETLMHA